MFDPSTVRLVPRVSVDLHTGIHDDVVKRDFSCIKITDPVINSETGARLLWGPNDLGPVSLTGSGIVSGAPPSGSSALQISDPGELLFTVTAEIARVRLGDRELLGLAPGKTVDLKKESDLALDLCVAGTRIAIGEALVSDDRFAFRLISVEEAADVSAEKSVGGGIETPGSGPSVFRVVLGRTVQKGSDLASLETGSVLELDTFTGKPFIGEVDGIPVVSGDILIEGDSFFFRVRDILEQCGATGTKLSDQLLEPLETFEALFSEEDDLDAESPKADEPAESAAPAETDADERSRFRLITSDNARGDDERQQDADERPSIAELFAPMHGDGHVFFERLSAPVLARLLKDELPYTISAVLSRIGAEKACAVVERLSPETAGDAALALSRSHPVSDTYIRGIERVLENRAGLGLLASGKEKDTGLELLIKILEKADCTMANWLRIWISESDPDTAFVINNTGVWHKMPESPDTVSAQLAQAIAEKKRDERKRIAHTLSRVLELIDALD